MGLLNPFKLENLRVEVYGNRRRVGLPKEVFTVMFNPETYSLSYQNVYSKQQGVGSSASAARYQMSRPAELSLKIIIDGTGVSDIGVVGLLSKKDVAKEVDRFLNASFYMDGNLHEPKFLKIRWGKNLEFDCRLDSVTVNYTLFDAGGDPLRAELEAGFVNDIEDKKREKLEKKTSPDLTHLRIVKEHDTLPLLCNEIYGTPDYYLLVAQANKLTDFRNLKTGQELFFPPLKAGV